MRKLGRTTAQRKAMLRGMVTLLLECGKIETTYTRAQEVSAVCDEMQDPIYLKSSYHNRLLQSKER